MTYDYTPEEDMELVQVPRRIALILRNNQLHQTELSLSEKQAITLAQALLSVATNKDSKVQVDPEQSGDTICFVVMEEDF